LRGAQTFHMTVPWHEWEEIKRTGRAADAGYDDDASPEYAHANMYMAGRVREAVAPSGGAPVQWSQGVIVHVLPEKRWPRGKKAVLTLRLEPDSVVLFDEMAFVLLLNDPRLERVAWCEEDYQRAALLFAQQLAAAADQQASADKRRVCMSVMDAVDREILDGPLAAARRGDHSAMFDLDAPRQLRPSPFDQPELSARNVWGWTPWVGRHHVRHVKAYSCSGKRLRDKRKKPRRG
jgi:hypothetical protein